MRERIQTLDQMANYIGDYFSKEYVLKNVLHFSEDEIEIMQSQIDNEGGGEEEEGDVF